MAALTPVGQQDIEGLRLEHGRLEQH
jgi:hypothetical protein